MNDLEHSYLRHDEPTRGCLFALRDLILGMDPGIRSVLSYSMPTFFVKKRRFCYLWVDKLTHHPYIGFIDGNRMDHPSLEAGDRSRMKIYRVHPETDLPVDEIRSLLQAAIQLASESAGARKKD